MLALAALLQAGFAPTVHANNILSNAGFDNIVAPVFGNNLNGNSVDISPWQLTGPTAANVVRVDGPGGLNYVRGPESDARVPGPGVQHYLDIVDGNNSFFQTFTAPACASSATVEYDISGHFSSRADPAGNPLVAAGSIVIREGAGIGGPLVTGPTLEITGLQDRLNWTQVSGTFDLVPGTVYSIVVAMDNDTNFDEASVEPLSLCITAVNDDFTSPLIPSAGGTTPSVFQLDDLDGATPTSTTVDVTLTNNGGVAGATIDANGVISVPANTPAGPYTLTYQICEAGSTTNCDSATALIAVAAPPPNPSIVLTKSANTTALSTPLVVGNTISYTFELENTGNTVLAGAGLTPTDTMNLGTDGAGAAVSLTSGPTLVASSDTNGNGRLDTDETFQYIATFNLTQAAIDAGGVFNTAVSSGNPVDSSGTDISGLADVSDTSDNTGGGGTDGPDTDGNGTDGDGNPTVVALVNPSINADKSASVGTLQPDGTADVTYTIVVTNTGNVTLTALTLEDDLTDPTNLGSTFTQVVTAPAVTLTNTSGSSVAPTTNGGGYDGTNGLTVGSDGSLLPGDSYAVTFSVNVDPAAISPPSVLQNLAVASGTGPGSNVATDLSDTDTAPDGTADGTPNLPNESKGDPTIITLPAPDAELGVVKAVTNVGALQNDGTFDAVSYTHLTLPTIYSV